MPWELTLGWGQEAWPVHCSPRAWAAWPRRGDHRRGWWGSLRCSGFPPLVNKHRCLFFKKIHPSHPNPSNHWLRLSTGHFDAKKKKKKLSQDPCSVKKLRDQAKLTLAALAWPMRGTRSIFGGGGGGGRPQEKMRGREQKVASDKDSGGPQPHYTQPPRGGTRISLG